MITMEFLTTVITGILGLVASAILFFIGRAQGRKDARFTFLSNEILRPLHAAVTSEQRAMTARGRWIPGLESQFIPFFEGGAKRNETPNKIVRLIDVFASKSELALQELRAIYEPWNTGIRKTLAELGGQPEGGQYGAKEGSRHSRYHPLDWIIDEEHMHLKKLVDRVADGSGMEMLDLGAGLFQVVDRELSLYSDYLTGAVTFQDFYATLKRNLPLEKLRLLQKHRGEIAECLRKLRVEVEKLQRDAVRY